MSDLFGNAPTQQEITRQVNRITRDKSAPACPHGQQFITLCVICTPPLEKDEGKLCDELMEKLSWRLVNFSQPQRAMS